jgi:hypothetical protein
MRRHPTVLESQPALTQFIELTNILNLPPPKEQYNMSGGTSGDLDDEPIGSVCDRISVMTALKTINMAGIGRHHQDFVQHEMAMALIP